MQIGPTKQACTPIRRYDYQAGYTLFSPLYAQDVETQQQNVPNLTVFRTDNRSRYDGLSLHLQGNVSRRFNLVVNYTFSSAKTWGCVLGELFDYVNGVCNPLNAFAKGDYGPSRRRRDAPPGRSRNPSLAGWVRFDYTDAG